MLAEAARLMDLLKWEHGDGPWISRETGIITGGAALGMGVVLGRQNVGACPTTGTVVSGVDTCSGVTAGLQTIPGVYTLTCNAAGATGTFEVKNPLGEVVGKATVGTAFTDPQINFTINDVGAHAAVGDVITITVPPGAGKFAQINFSAVDGTQNAAGILLFPVNQSNTKKSVAYTSGGGANGYQIQPGDVIQGATSGATATVVSLSISSGTFAAGTAAGTLILDQQVGTFQAENLNVLTGGLTPTDPSTMSWPPGSTLATIAAIGGNSSAYGPDVNGTVLTSSAIINASYLVWPSGATAAQIAAALQQLYAFEIKTRQAA
jgi:hypothetical protein